MQYRGDSSEHHRRLLPGSVEAILTGWLMRFGGLAMVAGAGLTWLALVSWSATDPSLTHSTGGETHNFLGAPGAVVADILLQTLGMVAVIGLIAPIVWGLQILGRETVSRFRLKLFQAVTGIVALAGGLSALPVAEGWPLAHPYGGLLGGMVHSLFAGVLALAVDGLASFVAGLALVAAGCWLLAEAIGLNGRDLKLAWSFEDRRSGGRIVRQAKWRAKANAWWPDLPVAASPAKAEPAPAAAHNTGQPNHEPVRRPSDEIVFDPYPSMPDPAWTPSQIEEIADADLRTKRAMEHREQSQTEHDLSDLEDEQLPLIFRKGAKDCNASAEPRIEPLRSDRETSGRKASQSVRQSNKVRSKSAQYVPPSLELLQRPAPSKAGTELTQTVLRGNARLLEDILSDFGVKGEIREIRPGPVITLFEFEPARGIKASRVIGLADDIARSMSAQSARIAVVPGRNTLGIELPNLNRETVNLREVIESESFVAHGGDLPIALGKTIDGTPIAADLARMPHLLVAGTTGSGKSVGVNAMILSLLYRHDPNALRFLMVDPKMLELSVYNGIPHLLTPVVTDPQKAVAALNWAVREMEERYKRMAEFGVRNIGVYNRRVRDAADRGETLVQRVQTGFDSETDEAIYENRAMDLAPMPHIVVVVDEFADLMIVAGKEIEAAIQRLAQMARAAGIHLIMATQRPSVDIVTGTIKANFPTRIGFKVASKVDSRTIINEQGAEQLLGQGDMLLSDGSGRLTRVHGAFVADEEVETVAEVLRSQGGTNYVDGVTDTPPDADGGSASRSSGASDDGADLYDKAVAIVLRDRKASTSYIQRRLSIGYNRAADLIERMEADGIIGPANHAGRREILGEAGQLPLQAAS